MKNFKRAASSILAILLAVSFCLPAHADDVNVDNIIHGDSSAVDRYSHSGEYGWIVECYVATTDTGKLDVNKSLTDSSNAAYLGRYAFVLGGNQNGRNYAFPALQRPVAIQLNGGGSKPQLTTSIGFADATSNKFPDPFTTGSADLQRQFQTGEAALQNFWGALEAQNGGTLGLVQKVVNVLSQPMKDKVKATGKPECLKPCNTIGIECPVEYAFVLTPLIYTRIRPGTNSSCNWNEEFWMGANEAGVLNRYSLIAAQADLQTFLNSPTANAIKGTELYNAALAQLQTRATKGELYWYQNMSHQKLPDSAFLDHNQFGISTPNRNAFLTHI